MNTTQNTGRGRRATSVPLVALLVVAAAPRALATGDAPARQGTKHTKTKTTAITLALALVAMAFVAGGTIANPVELDLQTEPALEGLSVEDAFLQSLITHIESGVPGFTRSMAVGGSVAMEAEGIITYEGDDETGKVLDEEYSSKITVYDSDGEEVASVPSDGPAAYSIWLALSEGYAGLVAAGVCEANEECEFFPGDDTVAGYYWWLLLLTVSGYCHKTTTTTTDPDGTTTTTVEENYGGGVGLVVNPDPDDDNPPPNTDDEEKNFVANAGPSNDVYPIICELTGECPAPRGAMIADCNPQGINPELGYHGYGGVMFCHVPKGSLITVTLNDLSLTAPTYIATCVGPNDQNDLYPGMLVTLEATEIGTGAPYGTFEVPHFCPSTGQGLTNIAVFVTNGIQGTISKTHQS